MEKFSISKIFQTSSIVILLLTSAFGGVKWLTFTIEDKYAAKTESEKAKVQLETELKYLAKYEKVLSDKLPVHASCLFQFVY